MIARTPPPARARARYGPGVRSDLLAAPRAAAIAGLALAGACGRLDFTAPAHDAAQVEPDAATARPPIHDYRLRGGYTDELGGPALTAKGGSLLPIAGYRFGANQGLTVADALPAETYTLDFEVALDQVSGWRKLVDFEGLTRDSGFYVYEQALQYVITPGADFLTTQPAILATKLYRVTLTRTAAKHVTAYIDGVPVPAQRGALPDPPTATPATAFEFDDTAHVAALTGAVASFFIDDALGGESSAGQAYRIRIWDAVLPAAEVALIPQ